MAVRACAVSTMLSIAPIAISTPRCFVGKRWFIVTELDSTSTRMLVAVSFKSFAGIVARLTRIELLDSQDEGERPEFLHHLEMAARLQQHRNVLHVILPKRR